MNERIFTELYKKVWGHFPCPTGEPELEKFAELIVREFIVSLLLPMLASSSNILELKNEQKH